MKVFLVMAKGVMGKPVALLVIISSRVKFHQGMLLRVAGIPFPLEVFICGTWAGRAKSVGVTVSVLCPRL